MKAQGSRQVASDTPTPQIGFRHRPGDRPGLLPEEPRLPRPPPGVGLGRGRAPRGPLRVRWRMVPRPDTGRRENVAKVAGGFLSVEKQPPVAPLG